MCVKRHENGKNKKSNFLKKPIDKSVSYVYNEQAL